MNSKRIKVSKIKHSRTFGFIIQPDYQNELNTVLDFSIFLLHYLFLRKFTFNAGLYHYAGNNPVRYMDPDGKYIINDGAEFNINGTRIKTESFAKNNYDVVRSTAGQSKRFAYWKNKDLTYEIRPFPSNSKGFVNDAQFADKATMETLKSMSKAQKEKSNLIYNFVMTSIATKDENKNGVLSVVLEVTMISCDCTGVPLYNEPIIVPVTVAFTTEDELKLFSSREAGLKTMVKDALRKANIDLEIGK